MSQPLLLIIEDEAALKRFLKPTLQKQGYQVLLASTGQEGLDLARSHNPDLVLLDLGLPDRDGLKVLQELRSWSRKPVIILSARSQELDKVIALNLGADDYVTKPFGAAELLARIGVGLRNAARTEQASEIYESKGLKVDLNTRQVTRNGELVRLTPLEYRLLTALIRRAGRVATHTQLLTEVWGPGQAEQIHYLRIYMGQLRHKLESDPSRPQHFLTEPGIGYRINVD